MPTGTPSVRSDPSGQHDFAVSWVGSINANRSQAERAVGDLVRAQIANGTIDRSSSATVDSINHTVTLHIVKKVSVFFTTITVVVSGNASLSDNGATTGFQLGGTVDAGGFGSASQVQQQLVDWVGQWERQAQAEPPQAPDAGLSL